MQFSRLYQLIKHKSIRVDEVAEVLEEVIIIKEGEIILQQGIEELLQSAYTVSGAEAKVDEHTCHQKVIHEEKLGGFKSATIYESYNENKKRAAEESGLTLSTAPLQS